MQEVEIKFWVEDEAALLDLAEQAGFQQETKPTREQNTLYDTPERVLRQKGQLVRLRRYGDRTVLTHKSRPDDLLDPGAERHKRRVEHETVVEDPISMDEILQALGYLPVFSYEKFRSEWSDGEGQLVVDITPVGTLAELEGQPDWIDRTAAKLGVAVSEYLTISYGSLFNEWKQKTGSPAKNMTFAEMHVMVPARFRGNGS
jgi:adenylate cyclase class 2